MTRLRCLAVAAAVTIAAVGQTVTAHADPPVAADAPSPPPARVTAVTTSSAPMGNTVMFVLDALGLADKGAPSPALRAHANVRTPTWLQPEPPKTPLFYSSLVVAKF
jgi:hypothetical protein